MRLYDPDFLSLWAEENCRMIDGTPDDCFRDGREGKEWMKRILRGEETMEDHQRERIPVDDQAEIRKSERQFHENEGPGEYIPTNLKPGDFLRGGWPRPGLPADPPAAMTRVERAKDAIAALTFAEMVEMTAAVEALAVRRSDGTFDAALALSKWAAG